MFSCLPDALCGRQHRGSIDECVGLIALIFLHKKATPTSRITSFKIRQRIFSFKAIYQTGTPFFPHLSFQRSNSSSQWKAGFQNSSNWMLWHLTFFRSVLDSWVSIVESPPLRGTKRRFLSSMPYSQGVWGFPWPAKGMTIEKVLGGKVWMPLPALQQDVNRELISTQPWDSPSGSHEEASMGP